MRIYKNIYYIYTCIYLHVLHAKHMYIFVKSSHICLHIQQIYNNRSHKLEKRFKVNDLRLRDLEEKLAILGCAMVL